MRPFLILTWIHSVLNLFLILLFIFWSRKEIIKENIKDNWKSWSVLLVILALSAMARINYPTHQFMYVDDWYPLQVAENIVELKTDYLDRDVFIANALMFVPSFLLFGASHDVAMNTALFFSLLSITIFFLLVKLITKSYWAASFSSIILAMSPTHVTWSSSTYNQMISFLLLMLTLYLFLLHLKSNSMPCLYASLASLLYLMNLRIEFMVAALPLLSLYIYKNRKKRKEFKLILPWIAFAAGTILLIPRYITLFNIVQTTKVLSFGIEYVIPNLLNIGNLMNLDYFSLHFFKLIDIHPILLISGTATIKIAAAGFAIAVIKKNWEAVSFIAISFMLFCIKLMLSPENSSALRNLVPQACLYFLLGYGLSSILASFGSSIIKGTAFFNLLLIITAITVQSDMMHTQSLNDNPSVNLRVFNSRLGEKMYERFPECRLITPYPDVYSATSKIVSVHIQGYIYEGGCDLLIDDQIVLEHDLLNSMIRDFKREYILERFSHIDSTYIEIPDKKMTINYTIFRVIGKQAQGTYYP